MNTHTATFPTENKAADFETRLRLGLFATRISRIGRQVTWTGIQNPADAFVIAAHNGAISVKSN